MPIPILFFGDSPDLRTGLGRIGRDLSCQVAQLPEFRVGYLGRAGHGSRQLPFAQYSFSEREQWGEWQIERSWHDFAGEEKGIIFTIWDASRLHWFARPSGLPRGLQNFLQSGRFARWGYFPVDATGPNNRLTTQSADTLRGYDRILAYGAWGAQVLEASVGHPVNWIPHGINGDVWKPREREPSRMAMGITGPSKILGCVMSNQPRKDWGLAFATFAELRSRDPNWRMWCHVDLLERSYAWNLRALIADYNLSQSVRITEAGSLDDTQLSYLYSACDVTILPSGGEGFGYPLVESMACNVPVIHGKYGGGAELVSRTWLVEPVAWRLEGIHNCLRPVFRPEDWADKIIEISNETPRSLLDEVEHLHWKNLWPATWKKWFLEGIGG